MISPKMGFRAALELLSLSYLSRVHISALRGISGLFARVYAGVCG